MQAIEPFLRYPGSKRRMLGFLAEHLPPTETIRGRFIEPFVGGGAIYFFLHPRRAVLSDANPELIQLYEALKQNAQGVWRNYRDFPTTKSAYNEIRDCDTSMLTPLQTAARLLYLNRTCFKGMWRHNLQGKFNVGYGGQARRWAIARKNLLAIGALLRRADLVCSDFEPIVAGAKEHDFIFVDPPYRPGEKEQVHDHYSKRFTFEDHKRLASCLQEASARGIMWAMTTSRHPAISRLYPKLRKLRIGHGTGRKIGVMARDPGEMLVTNW